MYKRCTSYHYKSFKYHCQRTKQRNYLNHTTVNGQECTQNIEQINQRFNVLFTENKTRPHIHVITTPTTGDLDKQRNVNRPNGYTEPIGI